MVDSRHDVVQTAAPDLCARQHYMKAKQIHARRGSASESRLREALEETRAGQAILSCFKRDQLTEARISLWSSLRQIEADLNERLQQVA